MSMMNDQHRTQVVAYNTSCQPTTMLSWHHCPVISIHTLPHVILMAHIMGDWGNVSQMVIHTGSCDNLHINPWNHLQWDISQWSLNTWDYSSVVLWVEMALMKYLENVFRDFRVRLRMIWKNLKCLSFITHSHTLTLHDGKIKIKYYLWLLLR